MATYTIYMYAPDALEYEEDAGEWELREDFDPSEHRVRVEITDDDTTFNGDWGNSEVGNDANQTANVYDMDSNLIATGLVYDELYLTLDDDDGSIIEMDVIEIGGEVVGYLPATPLVPGVVYDEVGWSDVQADYGTALEYSQIAGVPCFGPGTQLMTTEGEVPVEWLAAGQKLITKDTGVQPVLWVGRFKVIQPEMQANPALVPFSIAEDSFGKGCPNHPLILSRQHRVLLSGYSVELHAGAKEALATVAFLEGSRQATSHLPAQDIEYTHVLLAEHAVILANGMWTESLFLGEELDTGLLSHLPRRLRRDKTLLAGHRQTARTCLKRWQVTAMMGHRSSVTHSDLVRRSA